MLVTDMLSHFFSEKCETLSVANNNIDTLQHIVKLNIQIKLISNIIGVTL